LQQVVPIEGTDGEKYLRSRALPPPYPLKLYWLPNARTGEGAVVVELIAASRTVGVLLTYVDALGRKSAHRPARRRFNVERAPDAVMLIPPTDISQRPIDHDTIIVEGLENALSLAHVQHPAQRILGLPGIGALRHLVERTVRKGERVVVFRDGDPSASAADKSLRTGVDALILGQSDGV
jgi:hypothetical protein